MLAISRPVAGSMVVNVRPSAASRRSPPISSRWDWEMNSRAGAPSASGSVSAEIVVMQGAYLAAALATNAARAGPGLGSAGRAGGRA